MNNADYSNFVFNGKKSEDEFAKHFQEVVNASENQDKYEHWDKGVVTRVDVKSLKRISRNYEINENYHWLEILNINGNKGWVYAEKPLFFVFETFDYWVVVEKGRLQDFIKQRVKKERVLIPEQALYKLYGRKDRKDLITLVKTIDLIYIADKLIKKHISE